MRLIVSLIVVSIASITYGADKAPATTRPTTAPATYSTTKICRVNFSRSLRETARICEVTLAEEVEAYIIPKKAPSSQKDDVSMVEMKLVTFDKKVTVEEVEGALNADGFRPANVIELMYFLANEPKYMSTLRPIVALGSESKTDFKKFNRPASPATFLRIERRIALAERTNEESDRWSYLVAKTTVKD